MKADFVARDSILRKIWGKADTVLFIFAGAAAEFALNKAVDWLYFTGRLPADPLRRLFSTVAYARTIIFSEQEAALAAIDKITSIHKDVEKSRGAQIPDWAYRDVLFLLIDYSIRSYELLEHKLAPAEKIEVFNVFLRVGNRMELKGLPPTYSDWVMMRNGHLQQNLVCSHFTVDLYKQYRKGLGSLRYAVLKQVQLMLVPVRVRRLLSLGKVRWLFLPLRFYKLLRILQLQGPFKNALLPKAYKTQVQEMDLVS